MPSSHPNNLTAQILHHHHPCTHTSPSLAHPTITSLTATLHHAASSNPIGTITAHLITLNNNDDNLYTATQAYDHAHPPGAKLHKVWNFLANESFWPERQKVLDEAGWVLYLERVVLGREWRGRGLGLVGVDEVMRVVGEGRGRGIVLLEPGPAGEEHAEEEWEEGWTGEVGAAGGEVEGGVDDATEKIARHWRRMGFASWSSSDEAWLCLSSDEGERPRIGDVLHVLREEREGGRFREEDVSL